MKITLPALAFAALLAASGIASAQLSIGIATPGVRIGINVPVYPQLVAIPGYPVYYAPQLPANYFFYDGAYWVYDNDAWYVSSWYNGPWRLVAPDAVPVYLLRVPVRYYRRPPSFFRGWRADAPPRWGEHWGPGWVGHHPGWDRWDRHVVPRRAPLPVYQREYSGNRYPGPGEQARLHERNYRSAAPEHRGGPPAREAASRARAPERVESQRMHVERAAPERAPHGPGNEVRTNRAPAEVHRGGGRPEGAGGGRGDHGGRGEHGGGGEHGRGGGEHHQGH